MTVPHGNAPAHTDQLSSQGHKHTPLGYAEMLATEMYVCHRQRHSDHFDRTTALGSFDEDRRWGAPNALPPGAGKGGAGLGIAEQQVATIMCRDGNCVEVGDGSSVRLVSAHDQHETALSRDF